MRNSEYTSTYTLSTDENGIKLLIMGQRINKSFSVRNSAYNFLLPSIFSVELSRGFRSLFSSVEGTIYPTHVLFYAGGFEIPPPDVGQHREL